MVADPNVQLRMNRTAAIGQYESPDARAGDAGMQGLLKIAFEISEQFDTPVLLKGATRVSHSDSSELKKGSRHRLPGPIKRKPRNT
jgi:hypothetical protein